MKVERNLTQQNFSRLLIFLLKPFIIKNYNKFGYCFLILGFDTKEAIYPKKIAAAIPAADAFTPPIKAPINPLFLTSSIAPLASVLPNPVRGTVAPHPAKSTKYLYHPESS